MKGSPVAAAFAFALLLSATQAAAQHLVINEIDYDQPGPDMDEFIEIYNPGPAPQDLTDMVLVFVNGATNTPYLTIPLGPAGTLPAAGYMVVASATVTVAPGATVLRFASAQDNIQNGSPDGVALIDTSMPALIDALSYEGSMTSVLIPEVGQVSLVEGTALSPTVADQNSATGSLIRLPNGQDTDDASADWRFTGTPTPGAANDAASTGTGPPGDEGGDRSGRLVLFQNFPNPFHPTTFIRYELPVAGTVRLSVFDISGREVAVLACGTESAGSRTVAFNAGTLASGTYVVRLMAGAFVSTRRMELIR